MYSGSPISYRHAGYGVGSGAHRLAEYHDIGVSEIPGRGLYYWLAIRKCGIMRTRVALR